MNNRKKLILYILLGVLGISAGRAIFFGPEPEQETAPQAAATRSVSPRTDAKGGAGAPEGDNEGVRLDLLNRERESYQGTRHDLFAPLFKAKPSAPSMPSVPPPPPLPPVPPLPPLPTPPPPVTQSPGWAAQQELARFTYLGFLEKRGVKSIFLSSGDEIFVVKQGDRFGRGRQFQVAQLTPDRLLVRQENDPRPITIPLVEQAPLTPSGGGRGARFGAPPGSMPGGMGGEIPPAPEADYVPEETPVEEPPAAEEAPSPFVSPGQMGSPGVLQPLRPPPAPSPNAPPQFGPAFNQSTR